MRRRTLLARAGTVAAAAIGVPRAGAAVEVAYRYAADDLRHAAQLRDAALAGREAWRLVESLCTEIGARPAGSAADARAAAWALAQFHRLGLAAGRREEFPLRIWQRGAASARLVHPVEHPIVMAALGNSVATPAGGIEAEVAWYPSLQALRDDGSDRPRGRIVFIDMATERSRDGSGYGAVVGARFAGPSLAAGRGAVAFAIRSLGTSRDRIAHTGAMGYAVGVPRIPAFAVSVPDAERLARLHAEGSTVRLRVHLEARSDVEARSENCIAEVPGGDLADEVVLISAHLDSWDVGQGALDDGAGVGIVTAAAALIRAAGRVPRRTIRVVLFGNEENGFDGARTYGDRYRQQVHQLVGESDFGAGRVWRLRSRVSPEVMSLVEPMAEVLAPLGVQLPERGANVGSPGPDAAQLVRRFRWPGIELSQDGSAYFDVHHTENDTLDKVEPAALAQNVACWAATAWLAAQAPRPFGPLPS